MERHFAKEGGKANVAHENGTKVFWLDMLAPGGKEFVKRDKKIAQTQFLKAIHQYNTDDRMTKKSQTTLKDSLAHLLVQELCVTESTLKDLRVVLVSMSSILDIHDDVGHYESTSQSVTLHMNVCTSHDYFPGNRKMSSSIFEDKDEIESRKANDIFLKDIHDDDNIKAKLGSLDVIYNIKKKDSLHGMNKNDIQWDGKKQLNQLNQNLLHQIKME